jgi:hypothetical protein
MPSRSMLDGESQNLAGGQATGAFRQPEPDHPARRRHPHAFLQDLDPQGAVVRFVDAEGLPKLRSEEVGHPCSVLASPLRGTLRRMAPRDHTRVVCDGIIPFVPVPATPAAACCSTGRSSPCRTSRNWTLPVRSHRWGSNSRTGARSSASKGRSASCILRCSSVRDSFSAEPGPGGCAGCQAGPWWERWGRAGNRVSRRPRVVTAPLANAIAAPHSIGLRRCRWLRRRNERDRSVIASINGRSLVVREDVRVRGAVHGLPSSQRMKQHHGGSCRATTLVFVRCGSPSGGPRRSGGNDVNGERPTATNASARGQAHRGPRAERSPMCRPRLHHRHLDLQRVEPVLVAQSTGAPTTAR